MANNPDIDGINLASTSLPFADRSNAGVLREALALPDTTALTDSGGSLRAGSSALLGALSEDSGRTLVVASDCVDSKPASGEEATLGHGAAAVLVGHGEPLATLAGSAGLHQDFVDHYRAAGDRFSYTLEARWTRDAGYREQTRTTFAKALAAAGVDAVDRVYIAAGGGLARAIAKVLGAADAGAEARAEIGYCAAADPLLAVTQALEESDAGETFALVSIGQGVDVQVYAVHRRSPGSTVADRAGRTVDETNYCRYLSLRRLLEIEEGIRAERDNRTAQAAFWRKHESITGFIGGQCSRCGTLQFPQSIVCVECGAEHSQSPRRLADMQGTVRSFTEDWLAFTPKPPLVFGNVGFSDGANVMMEFTDVDAGQLAVGMPVTMRFRIKDFDDRRNFRRYFWKPTPEVNNG